MLAAARLMSMGIGLSFLNDPLIHIAPCLCRFPNADIFILQEKQLLAQC